MDTDFIVLIIALIVSVVLHEMAHGYAADRLGDPTARMAGRLSPNPIVHLDLLGSIIIPGLLIFSGAGFLFGWAKPVPYNPYNLRDQKWGEAKIAAAGPAANVALAFIFIGLIYAAPFIGLPSEFVGIAFTIIVLNFFLAFFNLLPLPPLDGSKIIQPIIGLFSINAMWQYQRFRMVLEQNVFMAFLLIIFVVFYILGGTLYQLTVTVARFLLGF